MTLKILMRPFLIILMASLLNLCWLASYGWAEMAGTQESSPLITREMLIEALHRENVQEQLEQHGISQVEAVARVNSLTDEEIAQISGSLVKVPAGGYNNNTLIDETVGRAVVYALYVIFISPVGALLILSGYFVFYPVYLPVAGLGCTLSKKSWGDCVWDSSGRYWSSLRNTMEKTHPYLTNSSSSHIPEESCNPGLESCT